jgi:glucose-1-phosphate cytidylyltransferase
MINIGDRPILWHIMKIYGHYGLSDFVVCLGYLGYVIKEYFANYFLYSSDVTVNLAENKITYQDSRSENWNVSLVDTGLDTNTGGRLRRVRRWLEGDDAFCMTYGDGVGDIDIAALVAFHRSHGKLATMTGTFPPGRFGAFTSEDGRVLAFHEKAGDEAMINGGFFVLSPKVLDLIDGDDVAWERAPLEGLAASGELMVFPHRGFWQPVDTLREKNELNALWEQGRAPWKVWS